MIDCPCRNSNPGSSSSYPSRYTDYVILAPLPILLTSHNMPADSVIVMPNAYRRPGHLKFVIKIADIWTINSHRETSVHLVTLYIYIYWYLRWYCVCTNTSMDADIHDAVGHATTRGLIRKPKCRFWLSCSPKQICKKN